MHKAEIDYILATIVEKFPDASDIIITVDRPFQVEDSGILKEVSVNSSIRNITPFQAETIALNLIGNDRKLYENLIREGSCDLSYYLKGKTRFRTNIFSQKGVYSIVLRKLENLIPTIEDLGLPAVFHRIAEEKNGMILVTGATGSGKSTSLATILEEINGAKPVHVITLEDPVEFVYIHKKATFNQRELGKDFDSFSSGLRSALRQAPKVILVGEMRDYDTVDIGLSASETGHLLLSTLHTIDAGHTINRILGMADNEEERQIRLRLADSLRWVVCQRLLPKNGGGRVAAFEIMSTSLRIKDLILNGESEDNDFYKIIEEGEVYGMITFDKSIADLYKKGLITEDIALAYASRRAVVGRFIDQIKSSKGEKTTDIDGLQIDEAYGDAIKYKKGTK